MLADMDGYIDIDGFVKAALTYSGYSLNSKLSALFPARWASVMDSKKASECSIGLLLPAR